MPIIHLLIVDDAAAIRRLVSNALSSDPTIKVAGTAATGSLALAKIPQLNPDLVILDVEMPGMNGLETLSESRKTHPRLPVIMFSALTAQGAAATIDALTRGANDYVTKPSQMASPRRPCNTSGSNSFRRLRDFARQQSPSQRQRLVQRPVQCRDTSQRQYRRPLDRGSTLSRLRRPRVAPMSWWNWGRRYPPIFPCQLSSCSTCRDFSPEFWPIASPSDQPFKFTKAKLACRSNPLMRG